MGALSADLRERLLKRMIESARPWQADEIAQDVLKLVSDPTRAEPLVSAILSGDSRFVAIGGGFWRADERRAPRMSELSYLMLDVPRATAPGDCVPIFGQTYDPGHSRLGDLFEIGAGGGGLGDLVAAVDGRLPVGVPAVEVRRRLHRLERSHACPSISERLIDIAAWAGIHAIRIPGAFDRKSVETIEERMRACRGLLDELLDKGGGQTPDEIESGLERSAGGVAVDFLRFRFGWEDLDRIPNRPGIYRFLGENGKLLYVGKSRDLKRRIQSYFRPLAPDHTRRAGLLSEIRDLSYETVPSELEALLLESETIQASHPPHNQQIEIHGESERAHPRDRDLGFVLCEGDPDEASVFLLRDGSPWARGRISRMQAVAMECSAGIVAAWMDRSTCDAAGLVPLDQSGQALVLRFLKANRDRCDTVRRGDFVADDEIASALAALVTRERPAWEPWSLRGSPD
jgi:hypothetical protein